jgi:hypothetical protein
VALFAMQNLRREREKCGLFPDTQRSPDQDRLADLYDLYVASPDACESAGTDWVPAAFDVAVVSCFMETRERSPLLLASARAAIHAATLTERFCTLPKKMSVFHLHTPRQ